MASQIKPEFSNLFSELCEEQVMLYIQGEEVKNRKKQRKVETEVADLRLKLATIQSRNIVLSNREIRLLRSVKRCHRYFAVIIISIHYVHFHGYVCSVKFR